MNGRVVQNKTKTMSDLEGREQFTCDIREGCSLAAGDIVIVEVHHDDALLFFLGRPREKEMEEMSSYGI